MVADFFAELARRALTVSGLAVLLSVILPKGGMRDCARLVLGVMLVASLLDPVLALLVSSGESARVSAEIFTDWGAVGRNTTDEIIEAGGRIAEGARGKEQERMAEDLERQIAALICRDETIDKCEVTVEFADEVAAVSGGSNNWGRVFIVLSVSGAAAADVADRVVGEVAAFYGLSEEAVRVSVVEY